MNQKILILEDEHPLRVLLKDNLEFENFEVLEAGSGAEALALASRTVPDAAVVDLGLPDMSGWEVCRRLRENEATKDIPLILLTADVESKVKPKIEKLRIDRCVFKPYSPKELIRVLRGILERSP